MTLQVGILGPVEARLDGELIDLRGPRQRRLLAVLALSNGAIVDASRLIDVVWPDGDMPTDPRETLRTYVSRLRNSLGGHDRVVARAGGYALDVNGHEIDAVIFEETLRRCTEDQGLRGQEKVDALAAALRLWRGPALSGFEAEEWALPAAARFMELRAIALDEYAHAQLDVGSFEEAVATLKGAVGEQPLRERAHRLLMTALYRCGRQAEALRVYNSYRRRLATDLGLEPGDEIRKLEKRIAIGASDDSRAPMVDAPVRGYEIRERIGDGAFAVVYRGFQPSVGRDVAVKEIRSELADRPEFIRRFEAEAHLVARLEHPHIVPLYDYWREPSRAYLVMRWFRQGSLEDALAAGPWPLDRALRMVDQIGAALLHAHRAGVIHRDVKPANILLDDVGNAYLGDFGIAHGITLARGGTGSPSTGSPIYAAPEQRLGRPVGPPADIYGLAIVLYEVLTGALPFAEAGNSHDASTEPTAPIGSIVAVRPELPAGLDEFFARATTADPAERLQSIDEMLAAVHSVALSTTRSGDDPQVQLTKGANPFKGLRAFDEADTADFFGRDRLVDVMIERLARNDAISRFLGVLGPSGSGKSSLVRAGLLPALRSGRIAGSAQWYITSMVPGSHPFAEFEQALRRVAVDGEITAVDRAPHDELAISRAVRRAIPAGTELVLFIDQFEELFTLTLDDQERNQFLEALARAVSDIGSRLRVVLTLRADFYDRPLRHPAIADLVSNGAVTLTPLAPTEIEEAITAPARRAGAVFESGLVAQLMADVANQPGALPLLQYALTELFDRSESGVLRSSDYHQLGGLAGALSSSADRLYLDAPPEGRAAIRRTMMRLITFGEGSEDTRRRVPLSELTDDPETKGVIDAFGRARLLSFDNHPITREPTVEVAHEALIRQWPRLRGWLDEDRVGLRIHRQLTAASLAWAESSQDPSELLRGVRLANTEEWVNAHVHYLNELERRFFDAGIAARSDEQLAEQMRWLQQSRQNNRLRRALVVAAVTLALAVIAGSVAFTQRSRAEDQRALANQRADEAEAARAEADQQATAAQVVRDDADIDRMTAQSRADATEDPVRAALLAVEAYRRKKNWQTAGAIQSVLTQVPKGFLGSITGGGPYEFVQLGTRVIAGNEGTSLSLWDAVTWKRLRSTPIGEILSVALSADEVFTAVSGPDGVSVVAVDSGAVVSHFAFGVQARLGGFDPVNGDRLAVVDQGGTVAVVRWRTGEFDTRVSSSSPVFAATFSPDGGTLATTHQDGSIRFWDTHTGEQSAPSLRSSANDNRTFLSPYSPDATLLASATLDGHIVVWRLADGSAIARFDLPTSPSTIGVTFADDDVILVQTGGGLRRFSVAQQAELPPFPGKMGGTSLSPDRSTMANPSPSAIAISALDVRQVGARSSLPLPTDFSTSPGDARNHISADFTGRRVIVTESNALMFDLAEPSAGWRKLAFDGHGDLDYAGFTADGELIISVHRDRDAGSSLLQAWDSISMQRVGSPMTLPSPAGWETSPFSVSADHRRLAWITHSVEGEKPTMWLYDIATGVELYELTDLSSSGSEGEGVFAWSVSLNPDGTKAAVGTLTNGGFMWDLTTTPPTFRKVDDVAFMAEFSPTGNRLVTTAAGEAFVTILDAESLSPAAEPMSGRTAVRSAWHPSRSFLITDGTCLPYDETLAFRDLALWDTEHAVEIGKGLPYNCGFWLPDGTGFGGKDSNSIQIWDLDPEQWVAAACKFAGRNLTQAEWERYGPKKEYRETCALT